MEIKKFSLCAVLLASLAACSNDEMVDTSVLPNDGETTTVNFEMNANVGNYSASRAVNLPDIKPENFRIMAFKQTPGGTSYYYAQDIETAGMAYTSIKDNQGKLTGKVRMPIGTYKFVSTYGMKQEGSGFTLPELTPVTTELTNDLKITHNTVDGSSVLFLEEKPLEELASYNLGMGPNANPTVSTKLNRGVSRVDILFIQAKKDGNNYKEASDSASVFGTVGLGNIKMKFTGLNKNVNLVGTKTTAVEGSLFNQDFVVPELANTVTEGTSEADTQVGTEGYLSYDNILTDHVKKGSAHVHGAYVLPYAEAVDNVKLTLEVTDKLGDKRTINVDKQIPLDRNKVTLIKIYALSGTVFHTDVPFDITVDTKWLGSNVVEGEIN